MDDFIIKTELNLSFNPVTIFSKIHGNRRYLQDRIFDSQLGFYT